MGNLWSKPPPITPASIERYYAERAEEAKDDDGDTPENHEETTPLPGDNDVNVDGNDPDAHEDEDETREGGSDTSKPPVTDGASQLGNAALSGLPAMDPARLVANQMSAIDAAAIHLTIAIRAVSKKADDALEIAITALKQIDVAAVSKAILSWIRGHPWEIAAIVIPLILLACTPAFLGLVGFTADGIVASSIAAGVQAGIGSVIAGSGFATLTSAAMTGYGVPLVFGDLWGISSAALWGIAAWKNRREGQDTVIITDARDDGDAGQDESGGNTGPKLLE